MADDFLYDVFLSHSNKDNSIVRDVAERLRKDGLRVWFDEWSLAYGDNIPSKIEEGLEHSRVLVLCMSANAFGSDWAQLESGTFRFRDPLNKERRFLPLRLDNAPIKGSLSQFVYINWLPRVRKREYPKLLEACRSPELVAQAQIEPVTEGCVKHDSTETIVAVALSSTEKKHVSVRLYLLLCLAVPLIFLTVLLSRGRTYNIELAKEITSKTTGMKFALIPPGTFQMGSPAEEAGRDDKEVMHTVKISQPFYMSVYEVTQAEYKSVMEIEPSRMFRTRENSSPVSGIDMEKLPVAYVTWFDAIEFCNRLSKKDGLPPHYTHLTNALRVGGSIMSATVSEVSRSSWAPGLGGYRLPTEAEWEYACRANTTTPFHFGSLLNGDKANVNGELPYGTITKGTFLGQPTTVGSYPSNKFGLFDMHGNVGEWCWDVYDENVYRDRSGTIADPKVTSGSANRVLRGGSWEDAPKGARSATRDYYPPKTLNPHDGGFRVVFDGAGLGGMP